MACLVMSLLYTDDRWLGKPPADVGAPDMRDQSSMSDFSLQQDASGKKEEPGIFAIPVIRVTYGLPVRTVPAELTWVVRPNRAANRNDADDARPVAIAARPGVQPVAA